MAAKVDQSTSSGGGGGGASKVSMFGAKSGGFVIPKNKLSGSLVPIFRGGAKSEAGGGAREENSKQQSQRKTKWGPDLTQDAGVRKARALAYQTRVEQITKQLKPGALEIEENEGSVSPANGLRSEDAADLKESQKLELLELERREIIGEIILLNPAYKAPKDYKPLLKETKVPIPVNAHPGYNFIGLFLGPESNTLKRLQEETGAIIRVYGTKKTTREKQEITQADINEAQSAHEDLYISVSADSYDKIDAAVSLIELLLTPVFASSTTSSATTTASSTVSLADASQTGVQPVLVNRHPGLLPYQPPYPAPWFSPVQTNVPSVPSSGAAPQPLPYNSMQLRPPIGSFNPPAYRTSLPFARPHSSMQPMQHPQPPYRAAPFQTNSSGPPFGSSQGIQSPVVPAIRPPLTVSPQPMSITPATQLPSRPPQTPPVSGGWLTAPQTGQPFMPLRPPISVSPVSVSPLPTSGPQSTIAAQPSQPNMPTSVAFRPPLANFNQSAALPARASTTPQTFPVSPQIGPPLVPAVASSPSWAPPPGPNHVPMQAQQPPLPSPAPPPAHVPIPMRGPPIVPQAGTILGANSSVLPLTRPPAAVSSVPPGQAPSSSGNMPSVAASRPPRPMSSDFTFQTGRPHFPTMNPPPPSSQMGIPQVPSFRPANQNLGPPVSAQGFQRPLDANQMFPPRAPPPPPHPPTPFARNPSFFQGPGGAPSFSPNHMRPMAPTGQMGFPSFHSTTPARPVEFLQPLQNPSANVNRPSPMTPIHPFGGNPRMVSPRPGGNQNYDPFSPSAVSVAPRNQTSNATAAKKTETDPEYEDLMASVGVK